MIFHVSSGVTSTIRRLALLPLFLGLPATLAGGCAGGTSSSDPENSLIEAGRVRRVVEQALQAAAAGMSSDALYTSSPIIVANGLTRPPPPYYAGIGAGGRVVIQTLTTQVQPELAWAWTTYRWTPQDQSHIETAQGTFVLRYIGGSWKIEHAHTSQAQPWEARR